MKITQNVAGLLPEWRPGWTVPQREAQSGDLSMGALTGITPHIQQRESM